VFRLGLNSKDKRLWQVCEDELERMGKLRLPLPERVYTEISQTRYQEIKSDKWYWVQRETSTNDMIYLEVVERVHHVQLRRDWYKTRVVR
jgi:hypothetical protein